MEWPFNGIWIRVGVISTSLACFANKSDSQSVVSVFGFFDGKGDKPFVLMIVGDQGLSCFLGDLMIEGYGIADINLLVVPST